MASAKTLDRYRTEALKKIERAQRQSPNLRPLEALFRYVSAYPENLPSGTAGPWRQQLRMAVLEVVKVDPRTFSKRQVAGFLTEMDEAVDALRGRPSAKHTASKKWKDPPKAAVVKVFTRLKERSLKLNRIRMAAAAFYCVLMPRLGARPVELLGATVVAGHLVLPNAKRAVDQSSYRGLDVRHWQLQYRVALAALLDIVTSEVEEGGYEAWLSILAETLARACEAVEVRRLAPSSFRHTALSTWAAAGYTTEEIARMAGHFSRRSPAHYIRTASAWGPEDAIVTPAAALDHAVSFDESMDKSVDQEFDLSPMPQPVNVSSAPDESKALWDEYRRRSEDQTRALNEAVASVMSQRAPRAGDGVDLDEEHQPGGRQPSS